MIALNIIPDAMIDVLNRNAFVIQQAFRLLKAGTAYDILDAETGQKLLEGREDNLGFITKVLRFTEQRKRTPFDVKIKLPEGPIILRLTRGFTLLRSSVTLRGDDGKVMATFKQNLVGKVTKSLAVRDPTGRAVFSLQGNGMRWEWIYARQ